MDDEQQHDDLVTVVVGEGHAEVPVIAEQQTWDVDEVCAAAVDRARDALLEEADAALIGEHTGLVADGPLVVTHYFEGHVPGYVGWRWAVTVTRAPDADTVTVDETALLPDGDALLAPAWVPWKKRIQPGDIGAGEIKAGQRVLQGLVDRQAQMLPPCVVVTVPDDRMTLETRVA